ncbi:MAG TPA: hypothetical protein VF590_18450 [Isosphaeraceae bacterium]|jgi:hypothetical protein
MSPEARRRYQTTIVHQRETDKATGTPVLEPREVVTDFAEFARGLSWVDLPEAERSRWSALLAEIHAARIELESLDAARRSRAKEILFRLECGQAEDELVVLRHAIAASGDAPA